MPSAIYWYPNLNLQSRAITLGLTFLLRCLKLLSNILKRNVQKELSINSTNLHPVPHNLKWQDLSWMTFHPLHTTTNLPSPFYSNLERQLKSNYLSSALPYCSLSHNYCSLDYWSHFKFFSLFLLLHSTIHFSLSSSNDHLKKWKRKKISINMVIDLSYGYSFPKNNSSLLLEATKQEKNKEMNIHKEKKIAQF